MIVLCTSPGHTSIADSLHCAIDEGRSSPVRIQIDGIKAIFSFPVGIEDGAVINISVWFAQAGASYPPAIALANPYFSSLAFWNR